MDPITLLQLVTAILALLKTVLDLIDKWRK